MSERVKINGWESLPSSFGKPESEPFQAFPARFLRKDGPESTGAGARAL
jgi:hypothetical protein